MTPRIAILVLPILLAACKGAQNGAAEERPPAAPTTITFTAAQIQHGGVRWEPVTATTQAGTLELPAQIVPNEDRIARLGAPTRGRVLRVDVQLGQRVR